MIIKLIITVGLILSSNAKAENSDTTWIESLKESVKSDKHIHQVIFFRNEKNGGNNLILNEVIKQLSVTVPVFKIDFPNYDEPSKSDYITYNPRISLFVIMGTDSNSEIIRSFEFLTRLSESKRQPKCLLLLVKRLTNYRQFFEKLWSEQFLDVTIIEIGKNKSTLNNGQKDSKVIQYNPFLDLISSASASLETIWFPEKLKNLHGYPLIASLLHAPPHVFVPTNETEELTGLTIEKINSLKHILNFTIVKSPINFFGTLTCSKFGGLGATAAIFTNEIQIFGLEGNLGFCDGKATEYSKGLTESKIGLVVPLIKKKTFTKLQWQTPNILLVIILPLLFWIISRLMNFHNNKWKIDYLIRIVLGVVVPEEPETTPERVIFLCLLFGCFMSSSAIYTLISGAQLPTEQEFEFETLENVASSNLQIMLKKNYFVILNTTDDIVVQQILRKSNWMIYSQDECVDRLLKYKNLSCILDIPRAELMLRNRKDECGQPLVKFFNEKFIFTSGITILGAGVPYVKRFDQVLQRIIESGVSKKWMEPYSGKKVSFSKNTKFCDSKPSESVVTIFQVLFLTLTGYLGSIIIFLLELILYSQKRSHIFCM